MCFYIYNDGAINPKVYFMDKLRVLAYELSKKIVIDTYLSTDSSYFKLESAKFAEMDNVEFSTESDGSFKVSGYFDGELMKGNALGAIKRVKFEAFIIRDNVENRWQCKNLRII